MCSLSNMVVGVAFIMIISVSLVASFSLPFYPRYTFDLSTNLPSNINLNFARRRSTHYSSRAGFGKKHFVVSPTNDNALRHSGCRKSVITRSFVQLFATTNSNNENNGFNHDDEGLLQQRVHPSGNPYADPNYPDLEFVNYDDPEYFTDQGESTIVTDEDAVEAMREERRRRNDEYQFQTYFADILRNGDKFYGEWTIYRTSTFLHDNKWNSDTLSTDDVLTDMPPRLFKTVGGPGNTESERNQASRPPMRVISSAYKEIIDSSLPQCTDLERIRHVETFAGLDLSSEDILVDIDSGLGAKQDVTVSAARQQFEKECSDIMSNTYWPDTLKALDFRGHQGIMVCGCAWTICTAVALQADELSIKMKDEDNVSYIGPFSEYRTELGIQENNVRLRLKFDYSILEKERHSRDSPPPLHLKSLTVCREALGMWPSSSNSGATTSKADNVDNTLSSTIEYARMKEAFFGGKAGADGGLYDPPPIKSDEQAGQYMLLDLEGKASTLFPYLIDQDPYAHNGEGWVFSLDWSPGNMRYQVDRKVNGGPNILGLRTLELSEVQSADAETYRPRDGGQNMRQ